MTISTNSRRTKKLPHWLRRRIPLLHECTRIESTVRAHNLHTVCREALCPNRAECYSKDKVTFMILGDTCTRSCRFCSVKKGVPVALDEDEPLRVARAVAELRLKYVVITSVTRDDLPDGGAGVFARTVNEIRKLANSPVIEVLIPDFGGSEESLKVVLDSAPDVLSHNVETVPRLYPSLRRGADYNRSLQLLARAKELREEVMTKSALILGLGEENTEIVEVLSDLRSAGCDFLAVGQYLQPTQRQVPVERFVTPEEFENLKLLAYQMGFLEVASAPLVRSSYIENDPSLFRGRVASGEGG